MHFNIPHKFSQPEAVMRVKQGLLQARPHLKDQATIDKEEWQGNTLNFAVTTQGKQITGTLEVTDKAYIVDAKLPLMWRIFEGRIEKMIEEQAKGMLK